jgi:hypothetical protein
MLISNPLKMFLKNRHTFANNFLLVHFFKEIFNGYEISVKFCVF